MNGLERCMGTLLGSTLAVLVQIVLSSHSGVMLFSCITLWVLIFCMSRLQILTGGGSNAAFGAMTTFGVLYGMTLNPGQDLVFSALYRISCVAVAVLLTLIAVYLMHCLLNRFTCTRHHSVVTP